MTEKEVELRTRQKILLEAADKIEAKAKEAKRDLTIDELKSIEDNLNEVDKLQEMIDKIVSIEDRKTKIKNPEKPNPGSNGVEAVTFEVTEESDDFRDLGEYLQSVARAGLPRGQYIGGVECGVVDRRLSKKTYDTRATGAAEDTPSLGGFLVRKDWADGLLAKAWETMILAPRCTKFTISSSSNGIKIPYVDETSRTSGNRWGGIRAYWGNEGGTITASNTKIGQMNMDLEKIFALSYMTEELLADTSVLTDFVLATFPKEIGFKVDDAIVNGDGSGKPLGIISATNTRVQVAKETSQTATTIVAENILKMFSRMWPGSLINAVWFANIDTFPQLATLSIAVGTGGVPIWIPGNSLSGKPYNTILGLPVVFIEHCQTLGTEGDIILADMSQYLIIQKGMIKSASSIHVQFITDEVAFRWTYRINGQPLWHSSITPANSSNTQSPFITLATRS